MNNLSISDDELIQAICVEDNKSALVMIYDRHSEYLYRYILTWTRSPNLLGSVSKEATQESLAHAMLIKIFTTLWDNRETVMNEIDGIRYRLRSNNLEGVNRPDKHRTVREYLTDLATGFVYKIPRTLEEDLARKR